MSNFHRHPIRHLLFVIACVTVLLVLFFPEMPR